MIGLRPLLRLGLALLLAIVALPAQAQMFPKLVGRVVDQAGLLQPDDRQALEAKLAGIERSTGHQVVVATIADLQGFPLADYGYQLGDAWGIGGKGKDDGVLIFLAPNEPAGRRGPRIEVGYGLEPVLTDIFVGRVARDTITPLLVAGDIAGGLNAGVDAIAKQIALPPEEAAKQAEVATKQSRQGGSGISGGTLIFWLIILFFVVVPLLRRMGGGGRRYQSRGGGGLGGVIGNVILWNAINNLGNRGGWGGGGGSSWGGGGGWGGGSSDGGGGDGGGFSGGGGSFGGGGASGGW